MAIDQARHLNFFKEILNNSNNNNININNNQIQVANNLYPNDAVLPSMNDSSLLYPIYNLNDVIFQSKLLPPVKDDSGVTFNNSFVPPPTRKRAREPLIASTGSNFIKESNDFTFFGEDLTLQIAQQQLELDRLISQHMEKVRIEIEEKKRQQMRRIMSTIQESLAKKLGEKEEEITKVNKINWQLEERVKSLQLENQIWRELAQTNEATANALRSNLEQLLRHPELTDDVVSCCGSSSGGYEEEEEESNKRRRKSDDVADDGGKWIYRGKSEEENTSSIMRKCRKCGEGESVVLVLPCRHLCMCKVCGPTVNSCPVCNTAKNASLHVSLS